MTEVGEGDWPAQKRSKKVKELEDKIKKLEKENKKLLYKVHDSPSPDRNRNKALNSNAGIQNGISGIDDADELENGLLDLQTLLNEDNFREDEWLYVSPKLPPTPVQKKVTPREWLSEGHHKEGEDLPSLDDVRKSLMYNIDEAENLGDMPSYKRLSDLKRRPATGSRTSQRAEDKPKQGNGLSSLHKPSSLPSDGEEAVSVVKWKAKLPAEPSLPSEPSEEPSEEDAVPARKWKVKQVPTTSGGFDEKHRHQHVEEMAAEESIHLSPQSRHTSTRTARKQDQEGGVEEVKQDQEGGMEEVPVVKWKAKMPDQEDVPVVKWKAKAPEETGAADVPVLKRAKVPVEIQGSDTPIVKWKAKAPNDGEAPVMRRKAKMPEDVGGSDVPVVKWKARVPEDGNVPAVRRIAKMPPEGVQTSDVKWKAKVPEHAQQSDATVVRRKAKMPQETQTSEVPVVKWKAKMPEDSHPSNGSAMKKKAKMPEGPEVPVVKWKAKMPQAHNEASDDPVANWKASNPSDRVESLKPQGQKHSLQSPKGVSPRKVATMPDDGGEDVQEVSHSNSHQTVSSSSLSQSPVSSSTQLPQSEPVSKSSLSRRSSFTESRSPSPPSISPHVRMAIASPILSRRTPSPSRGLAGSLGSLNSRQSPTASPVPHRKHLQYISGGGQQSPATNRAFAGAPSPVSGSGGGHVSRIRTPRSQQSGAGKTSSPMKGLTPPGERKHRRVLPSGPDMSYEQGNRSNQSTPSRQRHVSPGQDTGEGDDDSWLEGCF